MTILQEIQDTVVQYANIISHVIKVDVEIVDENLIRLAGTGIYQNKINEDISAEGFVYKKIIETGEPQLIKEPGMHFLCGECPKRHGCDEKMEICTPIRLGEQLIGVIGLICFTDEQKNNILADLQVYREFLNQIADFISAKALERKESERTLLMMELLNQVIHNISKGVLILNNQDEIVHFNASALKQLSLTKKCLKQFIELQATGDAMLDFEEFRVTIDGKTFFLMGRIFPVMPRVAEYAKILIFDEIKNIKSEIYDLTNIGEKVKMQDILGNSPPIVQLKRKLLKIADSNSTVLITGESGTGKEMIARAIHKESNRHIQPFIAINCGAIPDALLESELFGYVKGAFTGADPRGKIGKFELANKGVLFLDEIGDMPLYLQVKILRVLQERKITRIGSNQVIDIDVRIIAATNKDLAHMIKENKFREDLYYRLNVIPLEIPPLRDRKEDIPAIAQHFVDKYSKLFNKKNYGIDQEAIQELLVYTWPGNIRELENTIEFMINMADQEGLLTKDTLPKSIRNLQPAPKAQESVKLCSIADMERELIVKALQLYGYNTEGKKKAAKALGIGIATLYRKIEEYGLSK